ncbi:DUF1294 domain-containing protein [Microcoleus sp. FACHB-1515]|uniref:DUF1294 domain-containing protein n=1 Tax=Cyanophyceae TaxID=3028117 RepID=UPI001687A682|nr:DUF1294 domain-containing protein [Microcoleus sp. FACHB-1515]MBD2091659.1 DUF1294 domain-containing protein [Microcoleus sp. FACHB-1515]
MIHLALTAVNSIPLLLYCVMSLLSFALYRDDKYRAEQGKWRVPEGNLLLFDLLGGWIGGFVAQRTFHHKISKTSYQFLFRSIVALHLAFWFDSLLLSEALLKLIGNRLLIS